MRKKDDNVYNKIFFRSFCGFYFCREYRQFSNVGQVFFCNIYYNYINMN